MSTKNGCFSTTTLKVSRNPFQFSSSRMLMKSKTKGFSSSYSLFPFFLGLLTVFFFFPPSFFSSSNLFYSSFFLNRYSSNSFSLSSQCSFSLRCHFINTFLPSSGHYLTVFIRSKYL